MEPPPKDQCTHWAVSLKECTAILCPFHEGKTGCRTGGVIVKKKRDPRAYSVESERSNL